MNKRVYELKVLGVNLGMYSDYKTACDRMKHEVESAFLNDAKADLRIMNINDDRTDELLLTAIMNKTTSQEVGVVKCHNVK